MEVTNKTMNKLKTEVTSNELPKFPPKTVELVPGIEDNIYWERSNLRIAKRATRNVVILGVGFMFVFTAFISLQTLQNTLNGEDGIGVISLATLYGASILSCLMAPWIIHKLKTKGTVVVGFLSFVFYVGTNFYPKHFILIPASFMFGMIKGPLWSAQSTYVTTAALNYAEVTNQLPEIIIGKFNGIFNGIFQTCQLWGNAITAVLLSTNNHTKHMNPLNQSLFRKYCGANDCGHYNDFTSHIEDDFNRNFINIPQYLQYTLLGVYLFCVVSGVITSITLLDSSESLSTKGSLASEIPQMSSREYILSTFKLMQNPNLVLLLPLIVFTGLEQGFIFGDFTKSYVNCALGVDHLGFVMVSFGAVNVMTSLTIGHVNKHIKRHLIVAAGALFHLGLLAAMLLWKPDGEDVPMFYVIAGCLGLCDAIWQTQSNTLFGVLFSENQEAAFANYRMFQASGYTLAFSCSYILCTDVKIYILGGAMVTAFCLYGLVEFRMRKNILQTCSRAVTSANI